MGLAKQVTHRSVGGDHERLDHSRGFVGPFDLNPNVVLVVHPRAEFRIVEVESCFTRLPHAGQRQHVVVSIGGRHISIGDVGAHVDDRFVGMGVNDKRTILKNNKPATRAKPLPAPAADATPPAIGTTTVRNQQGHQLDLPQIHPQPERKYCGLE